MPWTLNMCHSNKFDAFFPVKINKMWNFAWNCDFQEPLIAETWNLQHWIWHALNPKYVPLKPFWCIFPSQNQQNMTFWLFPELPSDKKTEKNVNLPREKVFAKASKSVHIGFWVCQLHNALCENFVWQVLFELLWFFCIFMGRSRYRVL